MFFFNCLKRQLLNDRVSNRQRQIPGELAWSDALILRELVLWTERFTGQSFFCLNIILKKKVSKYEVGFVKVNNLQRPKDFESAVKDKEAAKENIRVAENERPRLLLQAETELEQARKQAEIIANNAKTQSKILMNK